MQEEGVPAARTRSQLLSERRRGGSAPPGEQSPPDSPVAESGIQPLVDRISDPVARQTATRIQALLARSCSSEAQQHRVLAAAVDRARSPARGSAPAGSRIIVGGSFARLEPPSQRLGVMELQPRVAELAEEVYVLRAKLSALAKHLSQGIADAVGERTEPLQERIEALTGISNEHNKRIKAVEIANGIEELTPEPEAVPEPEEQPQIHEAEAGAEAEAEAQSQSQPQAPTPAEDPSVGVSAQEDTSSEPEPEPEPEPEAETAPVVSNTAGDSAASSVQQAATPQEKPSLQAPEEKPADAGNGHSVDGDSLDLTALKAWCAEQLAQMRSEHAASMAQILERDKQQGALADRVAALEQGQQTLRNEVATLTQLTNSHKEQMHAVHERIDATLGTE